MVSSYGLGQAVKQLGTASIIEMGAVLKITGAEFSAGIVAGIANHSTVLVAHCLYLFVKISLPGLGQESLVLFG